MARKPNYNQQRGERDRIKREKKAEKLKAQQERTAQRRADPPIPSDSDTEEGE